MCSTISRIADFLLDMVVVSIILIVFDANTKCASPGYVYRKTSPVLHHIHISHSSQTSGIQSTSNPRKEVAMTRKLVIFVALALLSVPALAHVDTAWVRYYDGTASDNDIAGYITVDGSNYVCITGYSIGSGTEKDYLTIMYDPDGDTVWVRRYDGPTSEEDSPRTIAVDGSGCVYVTGTADGWGTDSTSLTTIKYNADGSTAWVDRYNPAGNHWNHGWGLAIDDSGNVYATGESDGSHLRQWKGDIITIKYDADGDTVWSRRWQWHMGDERGHRVAVDDSGNVYVSGFTGAAETGVNDYVTIKYYPNGDTAWLRRYNGPASNSETPSAMALDDSGNVYVTGQGDATEAETGDYCTIKYLSDGDTAWVRNYNGPGDGFDSAEDMAVDDSGYVYVTGCSYGGSSYGNDYATIKYDSAGDTVWVRRYNGSSSGDDRAYGIVVDEGYNVYVTGYSYDGTSDNDCVTIRYNPDGTTAWVERFGRPGDDDDRALAIALKDSNDIYVTGQSWGGSSDFDYITISYVQFLCGDANGDGVVNGTDITFLTNYLYRQGPPPDPIQAGDCNMDGIVDVGDMVYLVDYLYHEGPEPCAE